MGRLFRVEMMLGTRGWNDGWEPHYAIKKSLMVYWSRCGGVLQYSFGNCVWQMFWGWIMKREKGEKKKEEESPQGGAPTRLFIMTHMHSVTKNIQLFSSLYFLFLLSICF